MPERAHARRSSSYSAEFGPPALVPPFDPLAQADLALLLAAGGEEIDSLSGDAPQLVRGPAAHREVLVREAGHDPLDAVMLRVVAVPALPAMRLEAQLLARDRT